MYKAYKNAAEEEKGKRRGASVHSRVCSDDEADASADEGRADPGTAESDQTASTAEGTLGRGTRRAATSTDYAEDPSPDAEPWSDSLTANPDSA